MHVPKLGHVLQERFWSDHTRIKIALVVTAKFHSAFVDTCGNLYMCGHGLGGRLGLGGKEGRWCSGLTAGF